MEPIYEVYNPYTNESEFEGSYNECQYFISNYGGGWSALNIRPV